MSEAPDLREQEDCPDGRACGWSCDQHPQNPFPEHMSPSQINELLTCGEKFRLSRLVRVPSRPMWASIGGSVVHKLTEELDRTWYEERHASQDD